MRVLFAKRHITFGPTTLLCLLTLFRVVKWQAYLIGYSTSALSSYTIRLIIWSDIPWMISKTKKWKKKSNTPTHLCCTRVAPLYLMTSLKQPHLRFYEKWQGRHAPLTCQLSTSVACHFFSFFFFLHTAKSSSVSSSGWIVWEHCCGKLMCARGIWHPCKVLQIMSLKMVIIVDLPLSFTPDFAVLFHPNEEATGYAKWTRCHLAQCVSSHVLYCYKTSEYKIWKGLIYVIKSNQSKDCREA